MQDRHDRDLTESVMLGPTFQTSWVMENLRDKFALLQTQTLFLHLIPKFRIQRAEPVFATADHVCIANVTYSYCIHALQIFVLRIISMTNFI